MLCVYVSGSHRIIETDYDDAITVVSSGGWGGSHGDRYHAGSCPSQDERERIKTFFFLLRPDHQIHYRESISVWNTSLLCTVKRTDQNLFILINQNTLFISDHYKLKRCEFFVFSTDPNTLMN